MHQNLSELRNGQASALPAHRRKVSTARHLKEDTVMIVL